jgi:hypothetical protein
MKYLLKRYSLNAPLEEQFLSDKTSEQLTILSTSENAQLKQLSLALLDAYAEYTLASNKKSQPISFNEEERRRYLRVLDASSEGDNPHWSRFKFYCCSPMQVLTAWEFKQRTHQRARIYEETKAAFIAAEKKLLAEINKHPEVQSQLLQQGVLIPHNDPQERPTTCRSLGCWGK